MNPDREWLDTSWYRILCEMRFEGSRHPDRPLSAHGLSRTLPVLLPARSQFIVEYAGDFLRQDPLTARVTGTYLGGREGTDGQSDFIATGTPPNATRRVRWYGFPRNVDLTDDAPPLTVVRGQPKNGPHGDTNTMLDVVPLRDLLLAAGAPIPPPSVYFEHSVDMDNVADYGGPDGLEAGARYCAAWKLNDLSRDSLCRPKLLRVTLVVDDPQARMTQGQPCEYVLELQR